MFARLNTSLPIQFKYQQSINCLYNNKYDNVMIIRPDMEILSDIPLNPVENIIYFESECNRCMDHYWFGTQDTIIKQLHNIFDNYIKNYQLVTTDNNEILIHQCNINNIKINHFYKKFVKQHYFEK